jgi:holo-[acyl-carrier protein] synthase
MEIYGIGTDIVECARIARMIERHGEVFLRRIYTDREITYSNGRKRTTEHFAARWAAKEAIFKALGTGWRGELSWTDFEIHHDDLGKPTVLVGGRSKEYLRRLRIADILVTLSHCRAYATATAVAVKAAGPA